MMADYFPLLDSKAAIADADRNLADALLYVDALLHETEGHYPPSAPVHLSCITELQYYSNQDSPVDTGGARASLFPV